MKLCDFDVMVLNGKNSQSKTNQVWKEWKKFNKETLNSSIAANSSA